MMKLQSACWFCVARLQRRTHQTIRPFSDSASRSIPLRKPLDIPPPFPVTKTCPEPSCSCPPTPTMPKGLPIDHEHALNGSMAAYAQQLLICTGQDNWTSRIEDDGQGKGWGRLARGMKKLIGRGGRYADVYLFLLPASFCFLPVLISKVAAVQQHSSHQLLLSSHDRGLILRLRRFRFSVPELQIRPFHSRRNWSRKRPIDIRASIYSCPKTKPDAFLSFRIATRRIDAYTESCRQISRPH